MTSLGVTRGPRVLAVDLALGKTGVAAWDPEGGAPAVWTFTVKSALAGHERERVILTELARAVRAYRPQLILIEDAYAPVTISKGWMNLMLCHGVVRHFLRNQAPLHVVNNSHIKIYGTGRGDSGKGRGDAEKVEMIDSARERYGHLAEFADDNQADAFVLMALGLAAYGFPFPSAPEGWAFNRAIEAAAPWPLLAGFGPPAGPTATTSRRSGRATRKASA